MKLMHFSNQPVTDLIRNPPVADDLPTLTPRTDLSLEP